jgi:hypothetical protein
MKHFISTRELADDKTTISSTRWAFATVVKVDIAIIIIVLLAALVAHFFPGIEDFDNSFFGSVAMLLGVITTLVTTGKVLQGFEPHNEVVKTEQEIIKEEPEKETEPEEK